MSPIVQSYIAGLQIHPHGKFYGGKTFMCERTNSNIIPSEEWLLIRFTFFHVNKSNKLKRTLI